MTTTLIIARHGNTFAPGETPRRVGGRTDLPLVEAGVAQGHAMAHWVKDNRLQPDLIFASPLQRTQTMARIVREDLDLGCPIQTLDFLREVDYGPDEDQSDEAVKARIGEQALKDWEERAIVPPGWKADPAGLKQNWVDFGKTLPDGKTVLVVTSNGIARFAHALTGNFEESSKRLGLKLATGALSLFRKEPDSVSWACTQWNIRPDQQ